MILVDGTFQPPTLLGGRVCVEITSLICVFQHQLSKTHLL